ncbi:MAG: hypothetical protein O3B24_04545 [Verrucomicrobia bacterium]|nr:hypothetical protein [Verrucomicrobiota bacterium]
MINFVWDLAQQRQILNTKDSAAEASRTAKSADQRIAELEQSFDRLTLITRALWEIVQQYHPIDDGYLAGKIQEIDLRDGRLDGKLVERFPNSVAIRRF